MSRPKTMGWPTVEDYFWAHIAAAENNCWHWTGPYAKTDKVGADHGRFSYGNKRYGAHRLSWEINRAPIPLGKSVLHRCDRPRCVNPDHLYVGDQKDNVRDREARGRGVRPPSRRTLTDEQVREIRARYTGKRDQSRLAREMGICRTVLQGVVSGRTYGDVR